MDAAPPGNTKITVAGFPDDEIRELADRIASLTLREAAELNRYLEFKRV